MEESNFYWAFALFLILGVLGFLNRTDTNARRRAKFARMDREAAEHQEKLDAQAEAQKKDVKTREEIVKKDAEIFEEGKKKSNKGLLQWPPVFAKFTATNGNESSYGFRNTVDSIRYYGQVILIGSLILLALLSVPATMIEKSIREDKVPYSISTETGLTRYCDFEDKVLQLRDMDGHFVTNPQGEYQCFVLTSDWFTYPVISIDFDGNDTSELYLPVQSKATSQWYYVPMALPMSYN